MKEFSDADAAGPSSARQQRQQQQKLTAAADNESVRTEDFASKFSQMLMPEAASSERGGGGARGRNGGGGGGGFGGDAESVRTEDFAKEFRKALVPPAVPATPGRSSIQLPTRPTVSYRPVLSSSAPAWRGLIGGAGGGSAEAESVALAEDREQRLLTRAQRPHVVAFDDSFVGGGGGGGGGAGGGMGDGSVAGSSIRAQVLRERIGSLLRVPPSGVNLDATDRRLQELLQTRQQRQYGGAGNSSSRNSSPPRVTSLTASRQLSPTRSGGGAGYDSRLKVSSSARGGGGAGQGRISPIREAPSRSLPADDTDEDLLMLADDEFANEVRYQSRLIQRELELERRRRLAGGGGGSGGLRDRSASPTRTPRESLDKKVLELDELNQQVRKTLQEKEKIVGELHFVQDCLRRHQAEVRLSEKLGRDNKSRAEDTKTELMLAEMKRDSTAKELEQLNEELREKKEQLRRMEETCRSRTKELQDFESIGIAKEEIESILAERDELYQLVRQNEDAEYQRFELERRLTQTREDMQTQASVAQQKVIALEEELEASLTMIAETSEERNSLKLRLVDLEDKMKMMGANLDELTDANRQLARAKEVAERERVEEVERLKMRMQGDLSHIQRRTEEEEATYKRQIQQLKENLEGLQREVDSREEVNCDFREQLMHLENRLALETEAKNHMVQETERHLEKVTADAERRLEAARDEARREGEDRLARERSAWQAETAKETRALQERLQRSVAHLEQELQCRSEELKAAQDSVRSTEAAMKTAEEEFKTELRERVRAALRAEKDKWDRESSERWQRELAAVKAEAGRAIDSLQSEGKKKGAAIKELEEELHKLAGELDREREKCKAVQRDRVAGINRLKEVAKEETQQELRLLRQQVEEETGQVREQLRHAEETLAALRSEFEDSLKREADLATAMERTERALVNQANAECLRIAQVLGVTPRRVTHGGGQSEQQQQLGHLSHRSMSSPGHPITAALANMEACSEELLTYCAELRDESHRAKDQLAHEAKEREAEADQLRQSLAQEKAADLQALRERLIQDHMQEISKLARVQSESLEAAVKEKEAEVRELRAGMQKWKSDTAERLGARLQDEFRREFDKKIRELRTAVRSKDQELQAFKKEAESMEQERVSTFRPPQAAAAGGGGSSSLDASAKAMLQLQERVKALREENMSLRKQAMQATRPAAAGAQGGGFLAESPRLAGSLTSLLQKDAAAFDSGGGNGANYVQHLESKLRALEDRVRRAERQNELIGKDRINSANKQQREQLQQRQQQLVGSARATGSSRGSGSGGGASFRASSGHQGSGR